MDVLLVEDDPCVLEGLADFIDLRLPNVSVMTCLSGEAALDLASVSNFHAIITDVRMPDMDGLTLMNRIHEFRPATPIIVLTGMATILCVPEPSIPVPLLLNQTARP